MAVKHRVSFSIALILFIFSIVTPVSSTIAAANSADSYWKSGFGPVTGVPTSSWTCQVYKYQGKIIIGGMFEVAGTTWANNVVAWDPVTSQWTQLGTGVDMHVLTFTEYHGNLIAGGNSYLRAWDGHTWSILGQEIVGTIFSTVVWNDNLWIGGFFHFAGSEKNISVAMWDGTAWHLPGDTSASLKGMVHTLCVYKNKLIAGGEFESANGAPANYLAAWDGTSWSSLGASTNGFVYTAIVYDSSLVVGGTFDEAGGAAADHIARWNGSTWEPFGQGSRGTIWNLSLFGDELVVNGEFTSIDGFSARHIALFDGSHWRTIDTGLARAAHSMIEDNGKLIVSGDFFAPPIMDRCPIATWDSANGWKAILGGGADYPVYDICTYNNQAILAGGFRMVGNKTSGKVAAWDGSTWNQVGTGINALNGHDDVNALAVYDNQLIAGGGFRSIDTLAAPGMAAWNGSTWLPLPGSLLPNGSVLSFATYNNRLIAAGNFRLVFNNDTINSIAAWDGANWSSIGNLTVHALPAVIFKVIVYDNQLIVCGAFDSVDGVEMRSIAAWDGSAWLPLGSGLDGNYATANALCVYDNALIVGGSFTIAGGVPVNLIARWDGSSWSSLGADTTQPRSDELVSALTVYDNQLIVGGSFRSMGGVVATNIASWDGSSWSSLGSGITEPLELVQFYRRTENGRVYALHTFENTLLVGGEFTSAGDKLSYGLAVWSKGSPTGTGDDSHVELPKGYQLAQNYPNPFNPSTQIAYELPSKSHVVISIYNLLGQEVRTLVDETQSAGAHTAVWDGHDQSGQKLATGMYFYKIDAGAFSQTKKMVLLK